MNNVREQLDNLKKEDIIWIIYFFLATAALISNVFERKSIFIRNNPNNKTSQNINITIFIITFFIYLYFVLLNWRNVEQLKNQISNKNILQSQARLIAALLFLVGGLIYLITEIQGNENTEVGVI